MHTDSLENRCFLARDRFNRTHSFEMRTSGERDDRRFWFCDFRERQNLARMIHTDLGDEKLRIIGRRKERERHADVVVETLGTRVGQTNFREYTLEKSPCCGLSRTSGDRYDT
jgi:hypothetical protein